MQLPNYEKSSLSITASVLKYYGVKSLYPSLKALDDAFSARKPRAVILLILDGMGANLLKRRLPETAFLRTHQKETVTAVYPSTTTAATTSIWAGVSPQEHGWLGWSLYFKDCARQIDTFLNRDSHTGELYPSDSPAETLMPVKFIYEKVPSRIETHAVFPFETYAAHGARHIHNYGGSFPECARLLESLAKEDGEKLICCYFNEPDHEMHASGVSSSATQQWFDDLNAQTEALAAKLPKDTLFILTADHGLVDANIGINLAEIPEIRACLYMPPSIEARASSLFVKPHKKAQFEQAFEKYLGRDFVLFTHEQVFENHLLGLGTPSPFADDFVGDYLACAITDKFLFYKTLKDKDFHIIGQHAGLTEDEMLVPVILG